MRLPRPLPRAKWVWAVVIGGPALLDWWADRGDPDGDTLTELIRSIYRTETNPGRLAIAATIGVGGVVLFEHFCKVV